MPRINLISLRQGTAAQWTSANPVLGVGEPGLESDTRKIKYGDGTTAWNSLSYAGGGASVSVSDAPPSSPDANSVWWNSTEGRAYIYYDNTWVDLSPGVPGPTGPTGVVLSDTAPTNTSQIWADSSATGSYIVPANGSKGQVLTKVSDTSYDTGWATPNGSGNLLINGAFDIWQRGTSATSSVNGYTAPDRWYFNVSGSHTVSQQTIGVPAGSRYCARVLANGAQIVNAFQFLETSQALQFAGKTVTASIKIRRNSLLTQNMALAVQKSATVDAGISATWATVGFVDILNASMPTGTTSTDWYTVTLTVAIPNDGTANSLRIAINSGTIPSGGYYEIAEAQLEVGPIATPFRRNAPSIQAELAACQRYYQRFSAATGYLFLAAGRALTTTVEQYWFPFKNTMRITPTSMDYSALSTLYFEPAHASIASITYNLSNSTPDTGYIQLGVTGATAKDYVHMYSNNTAAYFGFSAEL